MEKLNIIRQRRKKVEVSIMRNNGSGLEGVIVLGALAIASLVAAFTIKKGRKNCNEGTTNLEATDSCKKEDNGGEGLRFILQDSSSTLHQNSCCTNREISKIGITQIESLMTEEKMMHCGENDSNFINGDREIVISDSEQGSVAMTDENHVVKNEINESSVMETIEIEIEDEVVAADANPSAEENSTLESPSSSDSASSIEEEKCSPKQEEEEEGYSLFESSFSTEEEDEEEFSPMRSTFSTEEGEEYSPMRSSFPTEEEDEEEEYSPMPSSFSTEEDEEEEGYSPTESSFSTEEEEGFSPIESSFSTEEESSEGTTSSSTESNTEDAIWPAEMVGFLSLEPKEMNISQKLEEKDTTAKIQEYNNLASTEKLVAMNDKKEHVAEAKRQIWVWLGLVLLLLLLLLLPIAHSKVQPNHLS
ncbi:hypothetical protein CCACVL1_22201 [Corchorus capsularis]|uniref:Uncharacterized protein n=1 Tax=Corchorus capsularis TaxID=210143 RepID=A0A1R3H0L1_COCAP|nr:hypothetical protein CCACVL1_22201 [Corchorus capsularis]